MQNDEIQLYIDDIISKIKDSSDNQISRDTIELELKKFLEYGVPLEHAKQTLIKKYGGEFRPQATERKLIIDLEPNLSSVTLLGRIISVNPKDVTIKGEEKKIFYGILGDESGTIPFTAWSNFEFKKGDVLEISNAYTREWNGETKLNFGDRTKINVTDESNLPKISDEPKTYKIKDLRTGLNSIEVVGRILEINQREVEIEGKKRKVFSGIIGDETGKAQFTSWHDFKITKDSVIKITGGYIKTWKGIPQLTFDDKAKIEEIDDSVLTSDMIKSQKLEIYELYDRNGALDVEIEGTVIRIRNGSGLIYRCPKCNRVIQNDMCDIDGKVKSELDLRLKLDIDDGTGVVGGIINRELTEKLLDKSMDDLKKSDENSVIDEINEILFTHRIKLIGNALSDKFGISIIAKDVDMSDFDIKNESEKLIKDLGELI